MHPKDSIVLQYLIWGVFLFSRAVKTVTVM